MAFDAEKFHDELDQDLTLNPDNLNEKLFKIPNLYSKYMRMLFEQRRVLIMLGKTKDRKYKELYHHYTYNVPDSLTNKEIEFHILADPDYSDLLAKYKYQEGIVNDLDRAANKMEKLSFDVKNCIEWVKYLQGV